MSIFNRLILSVYMFAWIYASFLSLEGTISLLFVQVSALLVTFTLFWAPFSYIQTNFATSIPVFLSLYYLS